MCNDEWGMINRKLNGIQKVGWDGYVKFIANLSYLLTGTFQFLTPMLQSLTLMLYVSRLLF